MVKILKLLIVLILCICFYIKTINHKPNLKQQKTTKIETPLMHQKNLIEIDSNTAIYAGRYEKPNASKYDANGLPVNRKPLWLSQSEWKGKHIKNALVKARFKAWKVQHKFQWVNHMIQEAKKESKVFPDIPFQLYVAQAILESNYGLSKLANVGNNLFGHKYRGQSEGFLVMADDSPTDKFTKFKSQWYSLRSHSYLLMNKYRKRIKAKNPTLQDWYKALCGAINIQGSRRYVSRGNSVYATSCFNGTCYIDKLKSIIKKYKLK